MSKNPQIHVLFDSNIFSKEAVIKACYQSADVASFDVTVHKKNINVSATLYSALDTSADEFSNTLRNNVIDYQLREKIEEKTKVIKEILISSALNNALKAST